MNAKKYQMKKGIVWSLAIVGTMVFASCGGEGEQETDGVEDKNLEICYYSYNDVSTEFSWTAYKTSAKVGVGGSFNEMEITGDESSDDPIALLESMKFSMKTASVETNEPDRNTKIAELFFGTINTPTIEGSVKELKDNGKAIIEVTMNGVTADVEGDYTLEEGKFEFTSSIDVASWNAMSGIETLNEACYDLHTGDDGVSKLWSEVALSFTTQLDSDCN